MPGMRQVPHPPLRALPLALSLAVASCAPTAVGFASEPPPTGSDPGSIDPTGLRTLDPTTPGTPADEACEASIAGFEAHLRDALLHHLGAPPPSVTLPIVPGAGPARPGRLAIAVTTTAVRFRGWTFRPDESAEIQRALGAEAHVAALMVKEGAPDVQAVDLWVDQAVSVGALHALLSYFPPSFEPRLVVALEKEKSPAAPAEPPWMSELAADLASDDVAARDAALALGFTRAAPSCEAVLDALTSTKLRGWNDRDEFFARSLGDSARACRCEGIDLDASAALALRAAGATGAPTGVFTFARQAPPVAQPKGATVEALAKVLSARAPDAWRAPVSLSLATP